MKSTTERFRNNKDVKGFAFAEQYLSHNGYVTTCPYCNEKLILSHLTSEDTDKLKKKEIINYHCFLCNNTFKLKLKRK